MSNKGIGGGVNEAAGIVRDMGLEVDKNAASKRFEKDLHNRTVVDSSIKAAKEAQGIPEKEAAAKKEADEKRTKYINNYIESESKFPFAKGQRELLGFDPESFMKFKNYLPGETIPLPLLISQYTKKETFKARDIREKFNMGVAEWLEFNKGIPLLEDRGEMLEAYQSKETPKISSKREALNWSAEEMLDFMGVLTKIPKPEKEDITPEFKIPRKSFRQSAGPYPVSSTAA